ncbi:hypothetical protein, partial [Pseudomonas sp. MWU12-2345]|uniref:hypothetical protein n=1 Tax=Pseudomonas sp. MWU12-2345 TaxID=2928689 RepID=UPI00200EFFA0
VTPVKVDGGVYWAPQTGGWLLSEMTGRAGYPTNGSCVGMAAAGLSVEARSATKPQAIRFKLKKYRKGAACRIDVVKASALSQSIINVDAGDNHENDCDD